MGQKVFKNTKYKGMLIFYGNSGDYYLSIVVNKSWFLPLFVIIDFLSPKKGRGPTGTLMSLEP